MSDVEKSLGVLRNDAIARGMLELAITYGWSMLRLGDERIARQMTMIGHKK